MKNCLPAKTGLLALAVLLFAGCARRDNSAYQGYLEGEFVYLAAPLAGRLDQLIVQKGARVTAGTPLFVLEQGAELATLREAAERSRQAQARLADLRKGSRPSELAALDARLAQARAAAEQAQRDLERATKLHESQVSNDEDFDRARLNQETAAKLVAELSAQLDTAKLGARPDAIAAGEADANAAQAALDRAGLVRRPEKPVGPRDGLVYDTLYRRANSSQPPRR
ncbi:MAG: hypothetical protein WDM96_10040 [Lacunisphaera sp.]